MIVAGGTERGGAPDKRLAYLGTLAGGLAHEIKNPLSTISINLALLREDLGADASQARHLKRIRLLEREVGRLEGIVQDFLRLTRGLDLHPEPTDLNGLLGELLEFIEPEAKKERVAIRQSLDPSLPRVTLDRQAFRQVFVNLLVNARQAMPSGGELIVRTLAEGADVLVEVTDTGVGMSADVLARCFDAYFSTKKGGTGLGLPTARRIVEEHSGSIGVWSEPGKGTKFTVRLPVKGPPEGGGPDRSG